MGIIGRGRLAGTLRSHPEASFAPEISQVDEPSGSPDHRTPQGTWQKSFRDTHVAPVPRPRLLFAHRMSECPHRSPARQAAPPAHYPAAATLNPLGTSRAPPACYRLLAPTELVRPLLGPISDAAECAVSIAGASVTFSGPSVGEHQLILPFIPLTPHLNSFVPWWQRWGAGSDATLCFLGKGIVACYIYNLHSANNKINIIHVPLIISQI